MLGSNRISHIKGTRKLVHRNQLLTSLGLPALDIMIGGGLPVGSIFLIEEDQFGDFTNLVMKYYLAEGIMNDHKLLLASLDCKIRDLLYNLPDPLVVPSDKIRGSILWRQRHSKCKPLRTPHDECGSASTNRVNDTLAFGNTFGLNTHRGVMFSLKMGMKAHEWHHSLSDKSTVNHYENLYEFIKNKLDDTKYSFDLPSEERTVLRIAIISIGTGLWSGNIHRFLIKLRFLVRNLCAACFISIQPRLFDKKDLSRIEHLCDTVIQLESFLTEQDDTNGSECDGLVMLKKLPILNTWTPHVPDPKDNWVFKVKKGSRFILKTLPEQASPTPTKRIRRETANDCS